MAILDDLQPVQDAKEIKACLEEFNRNVRYHSKRIRRSLSGTECWIFDPDRNWFGPAKFVGYSGMTFPIYFQAIEENVERGRGCFPPRLDEIQQVLSADFEDRAELHDPLVEWVEDLLGSGAFRKVQKIREKWRFVVLQKRRGARRSRTVRETRKQSNLSDSKPELRKPQSDAPEAVDLAEPKPPDRKEVTDSRIVRDSALARRIKKKHKYRCQRCNKALKLADGQGYAEVHHLRPLGKAHDGPDVEGNVLVVCPNCHALLDFGAIDLDEKKIKRRHLHGPSPEYIEYHNTDVFRDG